MLYVFLNVRLFHGANESLLWQDRYRYRNYDDNTGWPLSRKSKLDLYYSRYIIIIIIIFVIRCSNLLLNVPEALCCVRIVC